MPKNRPIIDHCLEIDTPSKFARFPKTKLNRSLYTLFGCDFCVNVYKNADITRMEYETEAN